MKILCDHHELREAFGIAASVVPSKSPKPVLQNVLLHASEKGLSLLATDLELAAHIDLDAVKVKEPGEALLPAKQTDALLREIQEPTISLETNDNRCTLEAGGGSFVLLGDDPREFPKVGFVEKNAERIEIPAGKLAEMIRQTAFAAAREESRYAINGVLIECSGDRVNLVATDGRRLAWNYWHAPGELPECRVVVPLRALTAVAKALPEASESHVTLAIESNRLGFRIGNRTIVSQLLDNRFPDYASVIPKMADTSVEVSRELLASKVRQVAILSGGDLKIVTFELSSSTLGLWAEASDLGRADVAIEVDVKGAGGSASFNPDFILDALRVSDLDTIRIDMSDASTPAKFTLGESFTYVLMPISGS